MKAQTGEYEMIISDENQRNQVIAKIQHIDLDKGPWRVDGYPLDKVKTDAQRGLFHALARELAEQASMSEGDVKAFAKAKLFCTKQVTMRGIELTVPDGPSSEKYSKKQYTQFIEILYWMAAELGVGIGEGHL